MFSIRKYLRGLLGAQGQIQVGLDEYLENLSTIALDTQKAFTAYLNHDVDEFSQLVARINELETRLDTLRRDIETEIYARRLLPDTRGDILGLLENLDKIPNRMQSTVREIMLQNPQIPQELHQSLNELIGRGVQIVETLIRVTRAFLVSPHEVREGVKQLSEHEHEGDLIEQRAVGQAFEDNSLELAHKMQLHRLIERLGSICDIAEDIGDRLMISSLKRLL
jgi:predicted phosphate transport protein (TIGR00153 family)